MGLNELIMLLKDGGPIAFFALFLFALQRKWIALGREVRDKEIQITKLEEEIREYKEITLRLANVGERAVLAAEDKRI